MSSTNKQHDDSISERLTNAFEDRLDPDESVTDMTIDEFADALREAGFVTEDEIEASIGRSGSSPAADATHELFGTGINENVSDSSVPAETLATVQENMTRSSDPDDYGTGVRADGRNRSDGPSGETSLSELTGSATGVHPPIDVGEAPPEAYGTGVAGDTSGEEYRRREEQTDIWADAIEKAEKRQNEE